MTFLYMFAMVPIIIGVILAIKCREVDWGEFIGSAVLAFVTTGVFHYMAIRSSVGDYETWSGQIRTATFHPYWRERYTDTESTGTGKERKTKTVTKYRNHPEFWDAETTLGSTQTISADFYRQVVKQFGSEEATYDSRIGLVAGDHNVYVARNKTGYVYPVTEWRYFENRLKAVPTLFSFVKVPATVPVYDYPRNDDWLASNRLVGGAADVVDRLEFDRLNSRLGPSKQVNFILVGFTRQSRNIGVLQQSKWNGGRKNDLVLCYDSDNNPPEWAFSFGWTEQELVKRELEDVATSVGVSTETLPQMEKVIRDSYVRKDWHKFDYIQIPIPDWVIFWLPLTLLLTQAGYWLWALSNGIRKIGRDW